MGSKRPVKSAQQANQNWKSSMQAPQTAEKFRQGVAAVNVAPNASAASPQAVAKYQQATQDAVSSGRLAAANAAVPLAKWQQAAAAGAARLSSGAANGAQKHLDAATRMAPYWQQARDAAASVPDDGSEAAALAKVAASMRVMKSARSSRGQ